jgi:hypothetical protein
VAFLAFRLCRPNDSAATRTQSGGQAASCVSGENFPRDAGLAATRAKIQQLQAKLDALNSGRENVAQRALVREAEVGYLAQRVRDREQALDQDPGEIAKQRDALQR